MIVVSLLLILVAVVLLVLGLSGGSSALLIGSIVVSLLAAAALVIGARQAANMRRAAMGEPTGPDLDESFAGPPPPPPPPPAAPTTETPLADSAADAAFAPMATDASAPPGTGAGPAMDYPEPVEPPSAYGPDPTFADSPQAADEGLASPTRDKPRVANPDDAAAALAADAAYRAAAYHEQAAPEAVDEFGAADADDPDDEPLPQAVRPADAVQVARMNAEVLVVDGRPRYHLADCPHLVGRLTEALPVAEAVELGFSPCGLCRPVDRLVARARA